MGLKLILPKDLGGRRRLKGRNVSVRKNGWLAFSDELVKELRLTDRSGIACFVDTDNNTLAFQVTSDSNPNARPFHPRSGHNAGHIVNRALMTEKVALGQWNITDRKDDTYYTECPCGIKSGRTEEEPLDVVDAPVVRAKRKYTRRTK